MLTACCSSSCLPPFLHHHLSWFHSASNNINHMEQHHAHDSSPYTMCSTLLSMDCQSTDQHTTSKPINAGFQHNNIDKASPSCVSSNIDDSEKDEQGDAHDGMLQGTMIFDMLSAMQFNSHPTVNTTNHHGQDNLRNSNIIHATSSDVNHDVQLPWHLNIHNNNQDLRDHLVSSHLSLKDNTQPQPTHSSALDPITSFLKLPVLADPTKLELADQRLLSSYSSFINSYKEDPYATTTLGSNNHWFNSLQLESIRSDCSLVNLTDMEDEGHIVHYLDHNTMEGPSQEAKQMLKLNSDSATMNAHEQRVLSERYNLETMNGPSSNYHSGEQLIYTLNEGGSLQREHQDDMFDNLQMMMLGYNEGPKDGEYAMMKGSASSSVIANVPAKPGRRRGVRGSSKNTEERETQRMTHIAVERNRRRQMNEHLRVLRALMPPSYIQRGDQASIIGGAIEFVRELEQLLQCLESQKRRRIMANPTPVPSSIQPVGYNYGSNNQVDHHQHPQDEALMQLDQEVALQTTAQLHEEVAQAKSAMADIEVKVVERSEALIKILSQRRPRQLLHTIVALQDHLHFTIVHTNVTTIDNTVLYSFTVKISNGHVYTANQIATSVHELFVEMLGQISMKSLQ